MEDLSLMKLVREIRLKDDVELEPWWWEMRSFAHQFLLGRYILRGKNYYCFVFSPAKKIFGMKSNVAYSKDFFSSSSYDL